MIRIMMDIRAVLLFLVSTAILPSCTDEVPQEVACANVTFTMVLQDGPDGRSSDELHVNTLVVGIYNEKEGNKAELFRDTLLISSCSVNVQLALVKDKTYHFIFWAYNDACSLYDIDDLQAISMNTTNTFASWTDAEKADAFFATVENFQATANHIEEVPLARPLARINVGTSGKAEAASFKVEKVPVTFLPFTKEMNGEADITWHFSNTDTVEEKFAVGGHDYAYLAMAYVFAPSETVCKTVCALQLDSTGEIPFPAVDLQANYRTNIVGGFTEKE